MNTILSHCKKGVVVLGILSALISVTNSYPLNAQTDRQLQESRQEQGKNLVRSITRAEQAYRLEEGSFVHLKDLTVIQIKSQYYDFSEIATPNQYGMAFIAKAKPQYTNLIKDYAAAVGQKSDGTFTAVICEALTPQDSASAIAGTANQMAMCAKGTKKITN